MVNDVARRWMMRSGWMNTTTIIFNNKKKNRHRRLQIAIHIDRHSTIVAKCLRTYYHAWSPLFSWWWNKVAPFLRWEPVDIKHKLDNLVVACRYPWSRTQQQDSLRWWIENRLLVLNGNHSQKWSINLTTNDDMNISILDQVKVLKQTLTLKQSKAFSVASGGPQKNTTVSNQAILKLPGIPARMSSQFDNLASPHSKLTACSNQCHTTPPCASCPTQ